MTAAAPTYDLMLLLDPEAEEAAREKIVADARDAIAAQGEVLRHDRWGDRTMTYPIGHRTVADYHLLQFHAAGGELIGSLDRSLRITDGILRFRIVKLKPGVPAPPEARAQRQAAAPAQPTADRPAPAAAEAAAAEAAAAEPAAAEPAAGGPGAEPAAAEPAAAGPGAEPAAAEPAAAEPAASAEPAAAEPSGAEPGQA